MKKTQPRIRYLIWGAIFGFCFPIIGTLIELFQVPEAVSLGGVVQMHLDNPLLLIIDTAPFFLALFSYGIGLATERYMREQSIREADNQQHIGALEERNMRLDKLNKTMDTLVYTASHDLKAPLNNFQGMLTMLRTVIARPGAEKMVVSVVDKLELSSNKMHNTISDLLDISRMENELTRKWEPVSLAHVVREVVETQDQVILSKSAKVELNIPEELKMKFSQQSLESLFGNLISNALKYDVEGRPPHIQITALKKAGGLEISVQDNGRGIDLEQHSKSLFQMFKRFHSGVEGSGVGLYIVHRIIEKAGGKIDVDSTVDVGTTFTIYFPEDPVT